MGGQGVQRQGFHSEHITWLELFMHMLAYHALLVFI
jgi:hypothetical protein